MKAVVLVGGEGTRLRPLTYDLPKPMVPICGKPFTQYQLELMKKHNITEVIFSLGYKWDSFMNHFSDGADMGMNIKYVVEAHPLGTAGAIKNVEEYLDDNTFLVFNGDILSEMNLTEIVNMHKANHAHCTIALTPVDNPTIYGVVELDANSGITRFTEKPRPEEVRSNLINAGLYVLEPYILDRMEKGKNYSIERQIFPELLSEGKPMLGYHYTGYWMDIGTPEKYLAANHDLLSNKMKVSLGLNDGVHIGEGTTAGKNLLLEKPVWIGSNVTIGGNVHIKGPAVIGNDCIIQSNAQLDGVLLWDKTEVGQNSKLKDCLIGRECMIEDNVTIGRLAVIGSQNIIEKDEIILPETRI